MKTKPTLCPSSPGSSSLAPEPESCRLLVQLENSSHVSQNHSSIVPLKLIEYGVYQDLIMNWAVPSSIYLSVTILLIESRNWLEGL